MKLYVIVPSADILNEAPLWMEANWNHLTDEWSSNILKLVKRLFELALTCSDKLWPILLSHFNAFQMKLARGPCRLVSLSVISEYPMFKQTLIPQIPIIDTTTSSYTTTPGIANGLIPTQSTTMNIHELAIQLSTIPKLTEYIEKNICQTNTI